jgi:hypothetical protein
MFAIRAMDIQCRAGMSRRRALRSRSVREDATPDISEFYVVSYSEDEALWIARSLRTDQAGAGDDPVEALADVMNAVDKLVEERRRDPSVRLYRHAPAELWAEAAEAKELPDELKDRLYRERTGEYPEGRAPDHEYVELERSERYIAGEREELSC